jgi:hypothetical protein
LLFTKSKLTLPNRPQGLRDYLGFPHSQNGNYQTGNFLLGDR